MINKNNNKDFKEKSGLFIVLSVACLLSLFKIANFDIWWILSDGRYVIENWEIPYTDVFRFVSIGENYRWHNHLYLTGSIFYIVYLLSGYGGLVLFKTLIAMASFHVFYSTLRTIGKADIIFALALVILSLFAVRFRLLIRPDIFSFLLFTLVYFIVTRLKYKGSAPLYLLPFIHILWVNLHAGYFAGLVIIFTVITTETVKLLISNSTGRVMTNNLSPQNIKKLLAYGIASFAAIMINPYGAGIYKGMFKFLTTSATNLGTNINTARVGEWQPLSINHFKGLGICFTSEYGIILILFIISSLLVVKRVDLTDIVLASGFFFASTVSIRFIPVAVFVMIPAIYRNAQLLHDSQALNMLKKTGKWLLYLIVFTGIILGIKGLAVPPTFKFGTGLPAGKFPTEAVNYIKENNIKGNFFNSYGIGGYLIWSFYPERRVFMDGRVLDNIGDYYKMVDSAEEWEKLEKVYDFDVVVLENSMKDFVSHLYSNKGWSLVYWDDRALVFLKNIEKYNHIIKRDAYQFVRPTFYEFEYLDHFMKSSRQLNAVMKELDRNIAASSLNSEARLAKAFILVSLGKRYYDNALFQVKEALKTKPDLAMAHSALGWLYKEKGMNKEGEEEFRKALKLDPSDPLALDYFAEEKK